MRFKDIEVSGIENIVFNRKTRWALKDENTWAKRKVIGICEVPIDVPTSDTRTHKEMMHIVNELKKDRRFRMWVHFDTLNIVKKTHPVVEVEMTAFILENRKVQEV